MLSRFIRELSVDNIVDERERKGESNTSETVLWPFGQRALEKSRKAYCKVVTLGGGERNVTTSGEEMTVTPSTSDVADKAVSTDDVGSGMEVARIEAVLAALVETKVEAIKASSTLSKRSGSAPASPRQLRLTSTSTASSSLNHHHCHHQHRRKSQHHHHHHYQHHHHHHQHQRRKRHDSAPCDEFIEDATEHHQHNLHHGT